MTQVHRPIESRLYRAVTAAMAKPVEVTRRLIQIDRALRSNPKTMREIIDDVCIKYDVRRTDVLSRRRTRNLVVPRQEAMWRCATETIHSLPEIGRLFDRDHTTVLHGIRRHEKRLSADEISNTKA